MKKLRKMERLWSELEVLLDHQDGQIYYSLEACHDDKFDIYRSTGGKGELGLCEWTMVRASRPTMTKYIQRVLDHIAENKMALNLDVSKESDCFLAKLLNAVDEKYFESATVVDSPRLTKIYNRVARHQWATMRDMWEVYTEHRRQIVRLYGHQTHRDEFYFLMKMEYVCRNISQKQTQLTNN